MRPSAFTPTLRRWPLFGLAALLLLTVLALTVTGLASAQDDGLRVSVSADPQSPEIGDTVALTADIANAPPNETPNYYSWNICTGGSCFTSTSYPLSFHWDRPTTVTFQVTVSYGSGASASSDPHAVTWTDPNAPPTPTPTPEPTTPSVSEVRITSDPGDDDTYGLDETIHIALTFSENVDVTGTPRLKIDMDPADWGDKWASYQDGSGTPTLTFAYTVVEPNVSTRGIAVLANTLDLNGGDIESTASDTNADLAHTGLDHDAGHKVDWQAVPPCAKTQLDSVEVRKRGSALDVHWDAPALTSESCVLTGYTLEFQFSGGSIQVSADSAALTYTLEHVDPGDYEAVAVYAEYAEGASEPLVALQANFGSCKPDVTVTASAKGAIDITWTPVEDSPPRCYEDGAIYRLRESGNRHWDEYHIGSDDSQYYFREGENQLTRRYIAGNLKIGYRYDVQVVTVEDQDDPSMRQESDIEDVIVLLDPDDPQEPDAPSQVRVQPDNSNGLHVSWTPPEDTGGRTLTFYIVRWRSKQDANVKDVEIVSSASTEFYFPRISRVATTHSYEVNVRARYSDRHESPSPETEPVKLFHEPLRSWFVGGTPNPNTLAGRVFLEAAANKGDHSAKCYANGEIDCPPRTLVSLDIFSGGKYKAHSIARNIYAPVDTDRVGSIAVNDGGSGYTTTPTISFGSGCTGVTTSFSISGGAIASVTVTNGGSGCTSTPMVTVSGGGGSGASLTATLATAPETEQDTDPELRYSADFGVLRPLDRVWASGGDGKLYVGWSKASSGIGYVIDYQKHDGTDWPKDAAGDLVWTQETIGTSAQPARDTTSHTLTLANGTYRVRVAANTSTVKGNTGNIVEVTLAKANDAPPAAPVVTVIPGDRSLKVRWDKWDGTGVKPYGYKVAYREYPDGEWTQHNPGTGDIPGAGDGQGMSWGVDNTLIPYDHLTMFCNINPTVDDDDRGRCVHARETTISGLVPGRQYLVMVTALSASGSSQYTTRTIEPKGLTPSLESASVDGETLTLTFSEHLDTTSKPAPAAFHVTVNDARRNVEVAVVGRTVRLTLPSALDPLDTVKVRYTRPSTSPLRATSGIAVETFADRAVTNDTPAETTIWSATLTAQAGSIRQGCWDSTQTVRDTLNKVRDSLNCV